MTKTSTTRKDLTLEDLEAGHEHPDYLGWGYLGERSRAISDGISVRLADTILLTIANRDGWTLDELHAFTNSRPGRWYGDIAFGGMIDEADLLHQANRDLPRARKDLAAERANGSTDSLDSTDEVWS